MTYEQFLETKEISHVHSGFDIDEYELNTLLFPFQKFCVKKALKAGKYALFADTGLGKTIMQLEFAKQTLKREMKSVLILAPLSVVGQTISEGVKFGYIVTEIETGTSGIGIYITNYENLDKIEVSEFCGIILDESSILKNFDGKTKQRIIDRFSKTPYKLACTATPSPNDVMELCNHAEFLDVMSRNEMLAMYFVHDGGETVKWRLKGHSERVFWDFVSTWAMMITLPSDIGFDDKGYILPPLNIEEVFIETPKTNNGMLFNDMSVSATDFNKELRETKQCRLDKAIELANSTADSVIVWINHDEDGKYLLKHIEDAKEVKGSDHRKYKKETLLGFAEGKFRVLITKLKIGAMGLNFQNCHNQIFASLDFSFEKTYQGIRRSYRFGQKEEVNIYLIVTDTMYNVKKSIRRKQKQFETMQKQMSRATNRNIYTANKKQNSNYKTTKLQLPLWMQQTHTYQTTPQSITATA